MEKKVVKVLGYKTNERKQYASRADILVLYDDGHIGIVKDKCICGWCCKTCRLQRMLLIALLDKYPNMVMISRRNFSHAYPASTNKKWFIIEEIEGLEIPKD